MIRACEGCAGPMPSFAPAFWSLCAGCVEAYRERPRPLPAREPEPPSWLFCPSCAATGPRHPLRHAAGCRAAA